MTFTLVTMIGVSFVAALGKSLEDSKLSVVNQIILGQSGDIERSILEIMEFSQEVTKSGVEEKSAAMYYDSLLKLDGGVVAISIVSKGGVVAYPEVLQSSLSSDYSIPLDGVSYVSDLDVISIPSVSDGGGLVVFLDAFKLVSPMTRDLLSELGFSFKIRISEMSRSPSDLDGNSISVGNIFRVGSVVFKLVSHREKSIELEFMIIGWLVTLIAAIISTLSLHMLLVQPKKLREEVRKREQEISEMNSEMSHQASHSKVAGLSNRNMFHEDLVRSIEDSRANNRSFAVARFDIDDFKSINDALGTDIADITLNEVGKIIASSIPDNASAYHLNGDEFAIIVFDVASVWEVSSLVEGIQKSVAEPILCEGNEIILSVTAGMVMLPHHGRTAIEANKNSSIAMRKAKSSSVGGCVVFDKELEDDAKERRLITVSMKGAAARNELELHYQPLVSLGSFEVVSYEALVRWNSPEIGLLAPGKFIELAEATGHIVQIGYWVLEEACREIQGGRLGDVGTYQIAVNLSPRQFADPSLLSNISRIIAQYEIDPSMIEFEITESSLEVSVTQAVSVITGIKNMGFSIAIDDFGTGYSSFSMLKLLPVDKLKIDRCFVESITQDRRDQVVVGGLIDMAKKLKIKVVAEGIETSHQALMLDRFGCNIGQGWLFARPMRAGDMHAVRAGSILKPEKVSLVDLAS